MGHQAAVHAFSGAFTPCAVFRIYHLVEAAICALGLMASVTSIFIDPEI